MLTPFYKKLVAAIRAVDTVHQIDYEPWVLADAVPQDNEVNADSDSNLAYTFHFYYLNDTGISVLAPNAAGTFRSQAISNGNAVEFNEFGSTHDFTQISTVINAGDQYTTTTTTFTLAYSTTTVAGGAPLSTPSLIVVPSRTYPNGYAVSVTGATVTSPPGAESLVLQTLPGSDVRLVDDRQPNGSFERREASSDARPSVTSRRIFSSCSRPAERTPRNLSRACNPSIGAAGSASRSRSSASASKESWRSPN